MLRNITAALPGIAFQLALEAVSPLLGGLTKWAKGLETWINNARINSCETAKAIVSTAAEAVGYSSQETCSDLAIEMGLESDRDAARRRCATDRPASCLGPLLGRRQRAQQGALRRQPDLEGAAVHRHLPRRPGARADHEHGRHGHLLPRGSRRDPEPIAPTLTSISQLLYGQAAGSGTNVVQHLLRCNDYTNCDVVTLNTAYSTRPSRPVSRP
jgi:conjugative transfer pilus assembly protein TraH